MTTIIAKLNMYNAGQCFTKGKEYIVNKKIKMTASLMEITVINDQGQ